MSDKMREKFELAFKQADLSIQETGHYSNSATYWAWAGWQASREAMVVELPQSVMPVEVDHHSDLPLMHAGAVIAAIEAAGMKVKS